MPSYLLLTLLVLLTLPLTTPITYPTDAAAMRDLSLSLSAALPLNWDPTSDPCSWPHLTCSAGKITAIQIGNKTLSGFLPPSISNLTSLARLELQLNRISGPLPSLKGLSQLQILLLHDNNFTSMPPDFFAGLSSLQSVSIDNNPFEPWEIPASLADAAALVNFSANAVNLTGGVPDMLSPDKFASLNLLALANNLLEGSLPGWLAGSPVSVLWLNQKGNGGGLSGGIDVIQNMTNLSQLWLHSNNFTGALPDFSGLENLEDLQLRDNKFTGPVPDSLFLLESLKTITLTNNLLQGPVPVFPGGVKVDLDPDTESFCLLKPGKCDPRVTLLLSIARSLGYPRKFAENWDGNDPCGNWLGISCDRDGNITVLNFINMGLIGVISPAFSLFPSLQRLLLSQNNISGTIPGSLTYLVNLKQLDLSNNSLHGEVPKFGKDVVVKINGNPGLLNPAIGPPSPGSVVADAHNKSRKSSDVSTGIIVGCVFGVVVLLFTGCLAFHLCKRNNKPSSKVQSPHSLVIDSQHSWSARSRFKTEVTGSSGEISSLGSPNDVHMIDSGSMVIPIHVLRHVTNNFSDDNILGQGGFGTVYKGELHDGTKIAVKRMESGVIGSKGLKEFQAEITVLSKVRHRHLVSLLGYCLDGNERLLVYEYMTQGTLSRHLFNWEEEGLKPLEWKKRLSIAVDVARGVEYLHTLAHQSFIHRDLKPSNILLGDDMKAKVSDFGLVRLAPDGKCSVETRLAGTFGYLAPEYAGRVTTKADVFSFGVILMELITGRKALDDNRPEGSIHLVSWFKRMQHHEDSFHKIIDPTIDPDNESLTSINKVAELAGHCCTREPYRRPDMGHAVNVLCSLSDMWKPEDSDSLDDIFGIGLNMTLPEAVKKWQELELRSQSAASSSNLASQENTQSSIPTVTTDFANSFTSADGR